MPRSTSGYHSDSNEKPRASRTGNSTRTHRASHRTDDNGREEHKKGRGGEVTKERKKKQDDTNIDTNQRDHAPKKDDKITISSNNIKTPPNWDEWLDREARYRAGASPWMANSYIEGIVKEQNDNARCGRPMWHWPAQKVRDWCHDESLSRAGVSPWTAPGIERHLLDRYM
ncbi:hypothetical protein BGAL_0822g00010 [Botrytis galanthina]|uniref:Uncharacterized protein n=1 Tax=Botrytis galanthina TaxID=278940 RepID=A0A4S8QHH6_9HELO|nr:hypothetical protein BGAL_0822g00010 [Botrytis galanthina]